MNFKELLLEISSTPKEIKWKHKEDNLYGEFDIKDQVFNIEVTSLDAEDLKIYQFKFYRNNETKMFNDHKYTIGVMATIKQALLESMEKLNPDMLLFASSDKSKARISLYKLEAASLATKFNYHDITKSSQLKEYGYGSDVIFGIYRNEDVLKQALEKV